MGLTPVGELRKFIFLSNSTWSLYCLNRKWMQEGGLRLRTIDSNLINENKNIFSCQFERLAPFTLGHCRSKEDFVGGLSSYASCPDLAQRWSMHLISSKPILQLRYLPVWECVYSVLVHGIALSQRMDELIFGVESLLTCFVGYVWSDKSPVKFTNWNPQEPDSHQGQQPCVEMYSTGDWADTGCYSVKQFICKMPRCKTKHTVFINFLLAGCKENQFSILPSR